MTKKVISFAEMQTKSKNYPRPNYLWSGIKQNSFGLVFGPSKSGKTIFCENLAMSIAAGKNDLLGEKLNVGPKRVLFIGLEEFWLERVERNGKQYDKLSDDEKRLVDVNYLYQDIEMEPYVKGSKQWKMLEQTIKESKAEVVFIDSITRMNHGDLDNSKTAEKIMQRLRKICYSNNITLICIHHTRKLNGNGIFMDSMKGSSTFSQESDFAIGINRTNRGHRYLKKVFFRYAPDDFDNVSEFEMDSNLWLDYLGDISEDIILNRSDRRRNNRVRDDIKSYFDDNPSQTFKTSDLVSYFTTAFEIKERQVKTYLTELSNNGEISSPKRGVYSSSN
ncbi:MAG: AAA family ATPase [Flavobacteriaceae bacterium]|nr:AAA family ATPase [Flavobacteriaceae bacterium]